MLRLKINKEPYWLELGYGVKVKVKPCTSAVFYEAKAYMNSKLAELAKVYQANKAAGITNDTAADIENPVKREAMADKFLLIGLGVAGILEWDGVMEADEDKPAFDDELEEALQNGEIYLGGCCYYPDSPEYHCNKCGKNFPESPHDPDWGVEFDTDDENEDD